MIFFNYKFRCIQNNSLNKKIIVGIYWMTSYQPVKNVHNTCNVILNRSLILNYFILDIIWYKYQMVNYHLLDVMYHKIISWNKWKKLTNRTMN